MSTMPKPPLFNLDHTPASLRATIARPGAPTNIDQARAIAQSPTKGPDLTKPGVAYSGDPRKPGVEEPARWAHPKP